MLDFAAKSTSLTTTIEKVTTFCTLLAWACGVERDRPSTGVVRRRRAALVVVE